MIAKKIPLRPLAKSDYGYLVKYLTDRQGKNERLGQVSTTNCQSEDWRVAVIEILNTQLQNTRAVSDKTYHLILSFRTGEKPDDAVLKAIEARICDELGYREHQRISVVHHDTDNLHIHLAVNKIHPTRHTIHEPYRDHRTLGELCERLEGEYGLEADNHRVSRRGSENRAADMERHTGVQSLLGWIQRECAEQMRQAQGWAELHAVMAGNGLKLQERGNGLIITDGSGLGVKASSVARELSKASLEKRFGAFEPPDELDAVIRVVQARLAKESGTAGTTAPGELAAVVHAAQLRLAQSPPVGGIGNAPPPRSRNALRNLSQLETMETGGRRYQVQPVRSRFDTAKLYARYKDEQQKRLVEHVKATERKKRLIESAKRRARLKREAVRAVRGAGAGKRILYCAISSTLQEEIRRAKTQCAAERLAIDGKYPWRPWADWLRAKAVEGDQEALAALRARDPVRGLQGDTITGKGRKKGNPQGAAERDGITKKGTIIYHVGSTAVRDDGDRLKVSRGFNLEGLQAALHLAVEHYGDCIAVNGTEAFKEQVARAAAAGRLSITFADAALEHRRQELLRSGTIGEKTNGHDRGQHREPGARTVGERPGVDGGRDSHGAGRPECAAAGIHPTARGIPPGRTAARCGKPDVGGIGRKPPPQGQNRLRGLSELGVVQLAGGGQVLLPRDVPDRLEQQGTQSDYGVRRNIPGPVGMTPGQAAAEQYIAEREAMRLKAPGVPKHRHYDPAGGGTAFFAGIRQVEGETLVLLKREEEVLVLPVDAGCALRLKRVAVGETVTVTAKGSVTRTKGRKL